ncbi:competence protein ComK [Ornithinibacillus contaminans]|uniref:competence protein ComK n=1 Tax=Ornithinibacillus contaminans TaxID=694055 RepID=UPI00064DE389|nr:competence protein ComK [Ornithinibacillus contaminans]
MQNILPQYQIHEKTMALIPAKHIDYATIAIEQDQKLFINQNPKQIMKQNCLDHLASFEGRRDAVTHQIGYKRKVPIAINPSRNLFTFPTHSPDNHNCHWIFYHHILKISASTKSPNHSIITFTSGEQLQVRISFYVLEKQIHRTAMCVFRFGKVVGV